MQTEREKPVAISAMYWLMAGMTMCIVPHAAHMPLWIVALALMPVLWRLFGVLWRWPLPERRRQALLFVQTTLVLASFAAIYGHYHTLVGRNPGASLLIVLAGFKILETRNERDFYISAFLGFFVIITNFFYTQSIPTAIYMGASVLVLITTLITQNDRRSYMNPVERLRLAGRLLLQSLPIMLVLFVLFPRITGPLWGLPRDARAARTGVSDEMEPGTISELAQSDEVAFRVEFDGPQPEHARLYWRGPVLWYDNGRTWKRRAEIPLTEAGPSPLEGQVPSFHYAITLEPTQQYWLFALEMPGQAPAQAYLTHDYQLRARELVQRRIRYELTSYPDYRLDIENLPELHRALQLPYGSHAKTIALARAWRRSGTDPASLIARALRLFNEEKFYYTLTPPLLTGDNVDEFLFSTRQGFCEHYASAFTVLMRAAGIPARVVTGYQGGEYNPAGNYLIVYQRDAHAWAEVWLEHRGWVRVDPTAAVAPERVRLGIRSALPRRNPGYPRRPQPQPAVTQALE
jgi:Transglutaminase-like enzymes, putative cysteine proteases